jgi:hypothetical protein
MQIATASYLLVGIEESADRNRAVGELRLEHRALRQCGYA